MSDVALARIADALEGIEALMAAQHVTESHGPGDSTTASCAMCLGIKARTAQKWAKRAATR